MLGIIVLLLILQLAILLPPVQNRLKLIGVEAIENVIDANISIGSFRVEFPKKLKVNNILISKNTSDTLFYLGEFVINIRLLPLLKKTVAVQKIEIRGGQGDIDDLLGQMRTDTTSTFKNTSEVSSGSSWQFSVEKMLVEACYFTYRDEVDVGFEIILDIGKANIHMGLLDLESQITCHLADISNTVVSYESLDIPLKYEDTTTAVLADIFLDKAVFQHVEFTYIDSAAAIIFNAGGENLDVDDLLLNINHEKISLSQGVIHNTHCGVTFLQENKAVDSVSESLNWGPSLWRVEGNELLLDNFQFTMDYLGRPDPTGQFSSDHMNLFDVAGKLSDFILDADTMIMEIQNLKVKEGHGMEITKMEGKLLQENEWFTIQDLRIQTPTSNYTVNLKTTLSPTDYTYMDDKQFDINLYFTNGNWEEIDYFYPFIDSMDFLSDNFKKSNYELKTSLMGALDELTIEEFSFSMEDSIRLDLTGIVQGVMNPESLEMDFNNIELLLSRAKLENNFKVLISDSSITLPHYLVIKGNYMGSMEEHHFSGNLHSDIGEVNIREAIASFGSEPMYKASLTAGLFHLHNISGSGLDQASFNLETFFKGESIALADGFVDLQLDSLTYKDYVFKNVEANGILAQGAFESTIASEMSDYSFSLDAKGTLEESVQKIEMNLDVDKLDLQALHLYEEAISLNGRVELSLGLSAEDSYHIGMKLLKLGIDHNDSLYNIHPAELTFNSDSNSTSLVLSSYFYHLDFSANDYILDIGDAIVGLPDYFLSGEEVESAEFQMPDFQISGELEFPEVFTHLFFPSVPEFDKLILHGGYSNEKDLLVFKMDVSELSMGSMIADSLFFVVNGTSNVLNFESRSYVRLGELLSGKIELEGKFENALLVTRLGYADSFTNKFLDLSTQISTTDSTILVHVLPEEVIFSYDNWEIHPDNQVIIKPTSIVTEDFSLSHGLEQLSISTFFDEKSENLKLELISFNLGSLQHLLALDTVVRGKANLDLLMMDPLGNLAVSGNLGIKKVHFFDFDAGTLNIPHFYYSSDSASIQLSLLGNNQDISMVGSWNGSDLKNPVNADMKISSLNLNELNYLLKEEVNNARGLLEGQLLLSGRINEPMFNGFLKFTDAGASIKFLNSDFLLGTESITIRNNVFEFSDFGIINSKKQAAKINGSLNMGNFRDVYTDLLVQTDNMEIMNSTQKQNDILFGVLKAQAGIKVKGAIDDIRLNANVKVDKSTDITYIFPDQLALDNNNGIVQYGKFEPVMSEDKDIDNSQSFFSMPSFKHVISTIEIERGARFNLFFDPAGNNYLDAALNGTINYRMLEENTEVSGMFEVEQGTLRYSIPLVTVEKYTIEPGSFITLSNDLYNPYLNIVASSRVRSSTEGLMTGDPQVMVFKVLLYLTGELNDLKLHFDIAQEVNNALVSARLAQMSEQERNINAINLLVRGSFVFSLQGNEFGGTSTMDAQIDKFYTTHLNHLISENVSFVDLRFDVQSFRDLNSQGDTEMHRNYYYNIGKSFFKDRARVNYKGSMGIASDLQAEQVNSSFVQNELEVEVKFTKNGVLRGVLFRKNQYEGLLEGEVIETGGGLKLSKDFYSIGDIFTSEKRKEKKELEKSKDPGNE